jgi:hypothetical protein
MPKQTLNIKYSKNTGRVFSADEIRTLYFFGIPITNPETGEQMSDDVFEFYIDTVQQELEDYLNLKFVKQIYSENRDYAYSDWIQWGHMPTTFPVVTPLSLQGFLNTTLQIDYPEEWLSSKQSSGNRLYYRKINLVPIHGSANSLSSNVVYTGIAPHVGYFGQNHIPNYWVAEYVTGWDSIPKNILDVIGKLVSINIFHQLGDIIVGAGIASKSIGIDSLSQSISTTASATNAGYGARILGYLKDLDRTMPQIRNTYNKIQFAVA